MFRTVVHDPSPHYEYFLIDENGLILKNLGTFTGSPAWSSDGSSLALGCEDQNKLCIIDMTRIGLYRDFPVVWPANYSNAITKELDLPKECAQYLTTDASLRSISWSRDDNFLALVCTKIESGISSSKVCVLSLAGEANCWPGSKAADVSKLYYSPVEDILVQSRAGNIELVDSEGNVLKVLTRGYNPAWSPDGNTIAFSAYYEDGPRNGMALINTDGTGFTWLYLQPSTGEFEEFLSAVGNRDYQGISWSPDGKSIVFSAVYLGDYPEYIFKMELDTKKITILVNPYDVFGYSEDPKWGGYSF